MNPAFDGNARVNGRWGKGSTYTNLLSYITPSTGYCSGGAPSGPFVPPVSTCLNSAYAPAYTFGNAPRTAAYGLTGPGNFDLDISLRRSFRLHLSEASRLNLQADLYNVTNYVQFGGIGTTLGSASFGTVSSQANNARSVQLSGRVEF